MEQKKKKSTANECSLIEQKEKETFPGIKSNLLSNYKSTEVLFDSDQTLETQGTFTSKSEMCMSFYS